MTGIDLSGDYIEAARVLTSWVELDGLVSFRQANVFELPFKKRSFDAAFLIHVGMNIADKTGLFSGLARVLRPGARLGIYDIMRASPANLDFPLPWAHDPSLSFISTPDSYVASLEAAGFSVASRRDQLALAPTEAAAGDMSTSSQSPTLGIHLLMGPSARAKLTNLVAGFSGGIFVPYEIIAIRG